MEQLPYQVASRRLCGRLRHGRQNEEFAADAMDEGVDVSLALQVGNWRAMPVRGLFGGNRVAELDVYPWLT